MGNIYNINQKLKQISKILILVFVFSFTKSWGQTTDLIFSEYIEGSSSNKYIEIYNGTGSAVNLADYKLRLYANGASSPTNDVALSGSLATCSVVIYKNTSAALTLPGGVSSSVNAAVNFNGDDAVVLFKISTNSIVDIIGQIGCDPGSAWTSGANTTADKTLVRKAGVCSGITTNPSAACGVGSFPTLSSEWDVYNIDDASNLGSHANTCGGCGTPHTVTFNTNGGTGGSMSNQTASSPTNLTSNGFTKTGCAFAGWNTAADGSGTSYANGASYSFAADLTLYAQWNCNSITTGAVSNPPFALTDCTITATGNVAFTSSGAFVAGNIYTAQLSNASGSFASAVNIGTISSTANLGTIPITIPASTPSGTGYLIRVISSNPSITGSNSAAFTITLTCVTATVCPSLLGVLINGCSGSCGGEGNNEFVVMSSGSYSIPVSPANINLSYDNGSAINFTGGFIPQPGDITNLNTLAGCGVFVDASAGTIPANSTFIVMNSGSCFNSGFNNFCGSGTIYVVFSNDADWIPGGFFANSGATVRSFITNFSSLTGGTCGTTTYTYLPDNLTGGDGGSVSYSSPGGSPSYLPGTGTCAPQLIILPIDLIDFYATKEDKQNEIIWKVAEETNIESYMIEKSEDGINFSLLEKITLNQNKTNNAGIKTYSVIDEYPFENFTYYRLGTKGKDGSVNYHKIISVDEKSTDWKSNYYQQDQNLIIEFKKNVQKNSTIQLFDLSGKLLVEENITNYKTVISTQALAEGLYFIKIQSPYKTENFKIIIQK